MDVQGVLSVCRGENIFSLILYPILIKLQGLVDIGKKHPPSKQEGPIPFFDLSARVSMFTFFGKNGSWARKIDFLNSNRCSSNCTVSKLCIR